MYWPVLLHKDDLLAKCDVLCQFALVLVVITNTVSDG